MRLLRNCLMIAVMQSIIFTVPVFGAGSDVIRSIRKQDPPRVQTPARTRVPKHINRDWQSMTLQNRADYIRVNHGIPQHWSAMPTSSDNGIRFVHDKIPDLQIRVMRASDTTSQERLRGQMYVRVHIGQGNGASFRGKDGRMVKGFDGSSAQRRQANIDSHILLDDFHFNNLGIGSRR